MYLKSAFLIQSIFLVAFFPLSKSNDVFTSMEQIKGLSRLETFLTQLLDSYVRSNKDTPKIVQHFAVEMKNITRERSRAGLEEYINNPVNVFLLVRRYLKHWTELSNYLQHGKENDLQGILKENKEVFPKSSDLLGCATALVRIQEVYLLSAKDIADGKLTKDTKGPTLGPDECFELGYVTHRQSQFDLARDWLKETIVRMRPEYGYKGALKRVKVLEYLGWAEYQMGNLVEAIKHTEEILEKNPKNEKAKQALKSYQQQQKYRETYKNNIDETTRANHRQNQKDERLVAFERLCREEIHTEHPRELLNCFYKTDHPILRIKPAKIEVISIEPEIQLLHEAVKDSEIKDIIKQAKPMLQRAYVTNITTGEQVHSDYRISRSSWLKENESTAVVALHSRLEALTGLLVDDDNSDFLQVVNYGVGGHYEPHHDYLSVSSNPSLDDGKGDRIATVLLYLSDVTAGGATVFIEPEIVVKPKKGDAIFWYNLMRNGQLDARTAHGACPVIVGSKWVANKWILERGQSVKRPCSLNEDE